MIKVSVVIPVYNREREIKECIESVQRQTIRQIEIICIDDGSTDSTVSIIKKMKEEDDRISLIEQKHAGPGAARNRGIELAQGEYMCFLDSDDYYYDNDSLECMYDTCNKYGMNACCSEIYIEQGTNQMVKLECDVNDAVPDNVSFFSETQICSGFIAFIFKTSFIKKSGVKFPTIYRDEDPVFLAHTLFLCEQYYKVSKKFYVIRKKYKEVDHNSENIEDIVQGWFLLVQFSINKNLYILLNNVIDNINNYENVLVRNMTTKLLNGLYEINSLLFDIKEARKINIMERLPSLIRKYYLEEYETPMSLQMTRWYEKLGDSDSVIKNWFNNNNIKSCIVYGVGIRGNAFIGILIKAGINVVGTLDAKNNHYKQIRILSFDEDWPEYDAIIITPRTDTERIIENINIDKQQKVLLLDDVMENILDFSIKAGITSLK